MADDLVRVGCAAKNDRAVAVGLQLLEWRVLGATQRSEKLRFVPRAQQNVITPLGIGVFDPIFGKFRPLFDGRRARHITEPARVRTANRDVERPIGQTLVNEIILRDDRRRMPEVHTRLAGSCWRNGARARTLWSDAQHCYVLFTGVHGFRISFAIFNPIFPPLPGFPAAKHKR